MHKKSMPERRWETYRKNIEKNTKKVWENGAKIDENLWKIDVGMDVAAEMKNAPSKYEFLSKFRTLAFWKYMKKTQGIYRCFWVPAFSFRRTGANTNIQKTMPKNIKKNMFFHWKAISKSFKNRGRKKYQQIIEIWYQNGAKSYPKTINICEKT